MKFKDLAEIILILTSIAGLIVGLIWAEKYYKSHKNECTCETELRHLFFKSISVWFGTILLFIALDFVVYLLARVWVIWLLLIFMFTIF
ncbi:MAG: hypothetical protein IJH39_02210 [Clostridia bacterium]|nr:hypothetical protein [Clostridia bacterium]